MERKEPIYIRNVLLEAASVLLVGGPLTIEGFTYEGEAAIQLGYSFVAITQQFERYLDAKNA